MGFIFLRLKDDTCVCLDGRVRRWREEWRRTETERNAKVVKEEVNELIKRRNVSLRQ
jgi:hypothetical protein